MSYFLTIEDFYHVAEGTNLTANEVLNLLMKCFNGDYPIDELSTGYLDFS
jgi:hypothetical protein